MSQPFPKSSRLETNLKLFENQKSVLIPGAKSQTSSSNKGHYRMINESSLQQHIEKL